MVKQLIFVAEKHSVSRRQEAAEIAKKLAAEGKQVKLFLEGTTPKHIKEETEQRGFPVCFTEAEEMLPAMYLTILYSLSRFHAYKNARRKEGNPESDSFALEFISQTSGIQVADFDDLRLEFLAEKMFLEKEVYHTHSIAVAAGLYMEAHELTAILEEILQTDEEMAPLFKNLITRVLNGLEDLRLVEKIDHTFKVAVDFFFERFGVNLSAATGDTSIDIKKLLEIAKKEDAFIFTAAINPMIHLMGMYREIYLAYCIAKEEFDVAVVNVGETHTKNTSFAQLLGAAGITEFYFASLES